MQENPASLAHAAGVTAGVVSEAYKVERDRQRETQKELSIQGVRRQAKWVYLDKATIDANSPSRQDGLDEVKEALWRREFLHLIQKAGMVLKVPQWGIAGAALLCHRFFSRKSMKRNDRFVVATACLHLAAKVEENPKPIMQVVKECERIRHCKNPQMQKKLQDQAWLDEAKENVLMAERAVLYTLGFELNISHPYTFLMQQFTSLELQSQEAYRHLMQNTWNFINDSFRTTLCIQYPPEKLACAALFLANEINKMSDNGKGIEEVLRAKRNGEPTDFFNYFDISASDVETISHQILSVYEVSKTTQLSKAHYTPALAGNGSSIQPLPLKRKAEEPLEGGR